jgi:hypothetical protein
MVNPVQKPPFYESRVFQGVVAVIGLLTAIWAFVGAPRPWQVVTNISATTVPLSNTEIVLDASAKMATPFGRETKLEAAQMAIGRYVAPLSNEGIALRRTGGSCGESGDLLVGFDNDHGDDVRESALEQRPAGRSNIANAVRAAVDDFRTDSFSGPDSTNRILIFISGEDECSPNAGEEIREELDQSNVDTAFRFVALRPSGAEMKRLKDFRDELGPSVDAEIHAADSEKQLKDVVHREAKDAVEASAAAAARQAEPSAAPPEGRPTEGSQGEGEQAPEPSPRREPKSARGRAERKATEKEPVEKDSSEGECAKKEAAEKEPSEKERVETAPVEKEPVEKECVTTESSEKEPSKGGAAAAKPPVEEETSPGTTAPPETGPSTTPSPPAGQSSSSTGVALPWPFGRRWTFAPGSFARL